MTSPIRSRVAFLVAGVCVFALLIGARLVNLQVVEAARLKERAERQHRQVVEIDGRRGAITDRQGRELAVSVTTKSLYAHPGRVKDPRRAAGLLSPLIGLSESEIREKLESDKPFEWIARRLDPKTAKAVAELDKRGLEIGAGKPLDLEEEPRRFYPQGSLASQVVGFANIDQRGIEGIEKKFDDALQAGSSRYLALRDGRGTNLLQLVEPPKKMARDVVLTIDLVLQHVLERELDRAMDETGAQAATGVLLDPATGQVLAMASRPAPDPGAYSKAPAEARRIRAVTDLYEPGSTFKVVTISSALEAGTISPERRFDCAGLTVAGKAYRDVHPYGVLSVREILEHSSNIGAIHVGLTVPRESFRESIVRFGFGRRTGIELPGERAGQITPIARMSAQSIPSMSMGYEIGVTALQLVSAVAAIANEGRVVPPRVVLGTREPDGTFVRSPQPEARQAVSTRTAVTVANMLESVVVSGTGKAAAVPGYHIAGKTGTAKKIREDGRGYSEHEYFSSFTAFGPIGKPRLTGMIVLDTPRGAVYYGGLTAAPALGRVLADGLAYLGVPPDDDPWKLRDDQLAKLAEAKAKREQARRARAAREPKPAPDDEAAVVIGPDQVPDLAGKSLREAIATLVARGCRAKAQGEGVVVRQEPPPGAPVEPGMICALSLGAAPDPERGTEARVSPPPRPVAKAAPRPTRKPVRRPVRTK